MPTKTTTPASGEAKPPPKKKPRRRGTAKKPAARKAQAPTPTPVREVPLTDAEVAHAQETSRATERTIANLKAEAQEADAESVLKVQDGRAPRRILSTVTEGLVPRYPWKEEYGSYYAVLGASLADIRKNDGKEDAQGAPSLHQIRRRWREWLMTAWSPKFLKLGRTVSAEEERFRAGMEAYLTISSGAGQEYAQQVLRPMESGGGYAAGGHESWIAGDRRQPYLAIIPDAQVLYIEDVLAEAEDAAHAFDNEAKRRDWFRAELKHLPSYLRADRLKAIDILGTDWWVAELLAKKEALQHLRKFTFATRWRRNAWKAQGKLRTGEAQALSKRERDEWPVDAGPPPAGWITLALDHWLTVDDERREQLLFHELLHFDPKKDVVKVVGHDVTAFVEEMEEYGITSEPIAQLVGAAILRPTLPLELGRFGVAVPRQLFLFSAPAAK